jgi:hypothetical protein
MVSAIHTSTSAVHSPADHPATPRTFDDMVGSLRTAVDAEAHAEQLLSRNDVDWNALVADRLANLADGELVAASRTILCDGVEPKTLLLHDEPGRFQIVLNHFDVEAFERHRAAGRITPHFHQFGFATRMLHGAYHHLRFVNDGEVLSPSLRLGSRTKDEQSAVYRLAWSDYHCVLAPAVDTVSIQLRGKIQFQARRAAATVSTRDILLARDAAHRVLS